MLNEYNLPRLKVLTDAVLCKNSIDDMKAIGCEVYPVDLCSHPFTWREILLLTNNPDGFDITSNHALDPNTRFYDWLSYEIINETPDYCFVPFGSGTLYVNLLNINKREVSSIKSDPRLLNCDEKKESLMRCVFYGATTHNPKTKAKKLYSPYSPFKSFDEPWLSLYKAAGYCGDQSNVFFIREEYLEDAVNIFEEENIECEPSGAAGLSLLLQMYKHMSDEDKLIFADKKIIIVNTGKQKGC